MYPNGKFLRADDLSTASKPQPPLSERRAGKAQGNMRPR
jgi:hypothetical protein